MMIRSCPAFALAVLIGALFGCDPFVSYDLEYVLDITDAE